MTQEIEATITLENPEGVSVPITMTIEWPEDMGYYALQAINKFEDIKDQLWDSMFSLVIQNGDASLLAHLPNDDEHDH